MNKFYIIGTGPGTKDYLLPVARKQIQRADCLIGAKRLLSLFANSRKEKVYLQGNFKEIISYLKENKEKKRIALLVSGDPTFYSFLGMLRSYFKKEDYEVIPGISALQIAFAKLGSCWQDAKIISLHGRRLKNLGQEIKSLSKVFLFTDTKFGPQEIARHLLKQEMDNRKVTIFENLTYPKERIVNTDLKKLSKTKGYGLCVMLIEK